MEATVGWSKAKVAGTATPVSLWSTFLSSTAPNESSPACNQIQTVVLSFWIQRTCLQSNRQPQDSTCTPHVPEDGTAQSVLQVSLKW